MSGTTEDSILSNIPDLDVSGNDDATTEENTSSTTSTETGDTNTSSTDATATKADKPATTSSEGNTQAAPVAAPPIITRRDGLVERQSKDNPNTRDLVDPATGEVVAAGGRERATWERAQRLHHEAKQAQTQRAEFERRAIAAEAKVSQQTEVQQVAQQLNVDTTGQKLAVQIYARFLKDPVSVLSELVSEVKSKGYNIPFLEQGVSPGMDAQAMQMMLDQRLAPVMQQHNNTAEQARIQQEAKTTLDNFLDAVPEAMHNIAILGEMLTREPSLNSNLHAAWSKLQAMAYKAGFDPEQPLAPQYEAKQRQQQQPTPTVVRNTPAPLPLPNGRQSAPSVPVAEARKFDENSSYQDIIRNAMRESGYSVN